MKSPSDINDKKLNVIVSVCIVKSKTGYENKINKLKLAKLQLISTNIIISSFITSTYSLILYNIREIVRQTRINKITSKTKPTNKQSESEVRLFQKAFSLIMLHRLPSFRQHKKQQQKTSRHQQIEKEESASFLATGLLRIKNKLKRYINISNCNTKTNSYTKNTNERNIQSNILPGAELLFASSTSASTITPITPIIKTLKARKLSRNYCIQIHNTNNKHRIISYRISETNNTNCHCWNRNRNQNHHNIIRKNYKSAVVDVNQYKELISTTISVKKTIKTPANFNVSLFFSSLFSSFLFLSFLFLSSLTQSLLLSSFSSFTSSFKQYTWCFLLSFSSNLKLLTKPSLPSTSSSSFLLNSLELVINHV